MKSQIVVGKYVLVVSLHRQMKLMSDQTLKIFDKKINAKRIKHFYKLWNQLPLNKYYT